MSTRTNAAARDARDEAPAPRTFASAMASAVDAAAAEAQIVTWPSTRWQADPVGFARDVLGVQLWARQIEILEAIRDHKRVAVASGHKIGKSRVAIAAALWFFASFPNARVIMTSSVARQVDEVLWREVRHLHRGALIPLGGRVGELARTGLRADDDRQIFGFTASEPEAVAGLSGANLFFICDEASGIPDEIFEVLEGNRAGGARILMLSNPTKTEGTFFDAFHSKAEFFKTLRVSSEESPNVIERRTVIPGLCEYDYVTEKELETGRDSAWFKVRVLGEFCDLETGRILNLHQIQCAEQRWHEMSDDGEGPAGGGVFIGVDVAGASERSDDSVFAVRRGKKILEIAVRRGLTEHDHITTVEGLLAKWRTPREEASVIVDALGEIGHNVHVKMKAFYAPQALVTVVGIRSSDGARRMPAQYERVRDELWATTERFIRDGGAIPTDAKLEKELHAPDWQITINGKRKATSKQDLRKLLGRSPDRADAVALAIWGVSAFESRQVNAQAPEAAPPRGRAMDPYASHTSSGYGGTFDPYSSGFADPYTRRR